MENKELKKQFEELDNKFTLSQQQFEIDLSNITKEYEAKQILLMENNNLLNESELYENLLNNPEKKKNSQELFIENLKVRKDYFIN